MNVTEQLEVLTNISMVGNLNLTIGDAALLTETIDEVINSTEIDNAVSVHVLGVTCMSVDICFTGWQCRMLCCVVCALFVVCCVCSVFCCMFCVLCVLCCVVCFALCVFCVVLYVLCCVCFVLCCVCCVALVLCLKCVVLRLLCIVF